MRYAVASDFNGAACYFTGGFNVDREKGFTPIADLRRERAFSPADRAAARALAEGLSDLCRILPPNEARTWFVVELPDAAGYASQGLADLAGVIAGASGLPR